MHTVTLRKIIFTCLLAALSACGPVEQVAEEESAATQTIPLEGSNWQLVQIKVLGGFVFTPEDSGKYVLNFRSENRLTGTSDCNDITGTWLQEDSSLRFEPFSASRKLCPPGSLHNNLVLYLKDTVAHEFRDGHMLLSTTTEGIEMEFESR
ncbi:MAG: META domain-containing protein [Pseudohongiella sp.]|jgi:heat shock protein HslJ|nr:META domain-containing protein [Pseudohongiella sp.]